MKYTIIEDCSPYYIRFTHKGIEDIVSYCNEVTPDVSTKEKTFIHHTLQLEQKEKILSLIPMSSQIELWEDRVSLFITKPGRYYRAHKDGLDHRFSINYCVSILDNKCVTSWYSDQDLKEYPIDNLPLKISRECEGFDKTKHVPLKSMVAVQGECVLFNTDIFHDFDNSVSTNNRVILTLRAKHTGSIYFDDVKDILFKKQVDTQVR